MDDEWAARMLDREEAGLEIPASADDLTPLGYSDIVSRLDLLADRLMAVRTAVQAGYSQDYEEPKFEPLPRPTTAMDRERERRTRNVLLEVDALVKPEG